MRGACLPCLRRSWLLAKLGARLDFRRRDPSRLWDLLALPDDELIDAVGGRRRVELHESHRAFRPSDVPRPRGVETACRHCDGFPGALTGRLAPACLHVLGAGRLEQGLGAAVAIVGTRRASDYGMEAARTLARDLTAVGLRVVTTLTDGIAAAALTGTFEASGAPVVVLSGDVERCTPACCAGVYRQTAAKGCLVSELPSGAAGRTWSALARGRTVVLAAQMTIVVELEHGAPELCWIELAKAAGATVAAVPGRVTSPAASGANLLIRDGAILVRDAQDALEALYGVGSSSARTTPASLDPRLDATLRAVGDGRDTLAKLLDGGAQRAEAAIALAELELLGVLARGDGGRYVPCASALAGPPSDRLGGDERSVPANIALPTRL